MPATITTRLRQHLADQLFESFGEASPSRLYVTLGRPVSWPDEGNPPTPTDTVQNTFDPWRDMIGMKRIQDSDKSFVITRRNWTNNTVYTQYTDTNTSLPTASFYVMTSNSNVYKCIDNNRNAASTISPTGTSTLITTTADGYRWKYMYTISAADALKFMTTNYIPVKTLTANDGSAQWPVQEAASNGAIHHVVISANGTSYQSTSNTLASTTNSTVVVLKSNAVATDDFYNFSTIYIVAGTGSGQLRRIVNYVGASRTVTVNGAFTTLPDATSQYQIAPNVIIRGDGVTTATAYCSNVTSGQIKKITMIAAGANYSIANVTITANSTHGSGATVTPVISPQGGHGKNPVGELYGYNIMFNVQVAGSESSTLPTNNDFRVIGLVRDPRLSAGGLANASVLGCTTVLNIQSATGNFTADEVITGGTSGAKGRLAWFANTNAAHTKGNMYLTRVSRAGTGVNFTTGETITGGTSSKSATIVSRTNPTVRHYTGDVMYVENRGAVSRATDQTEDIKIVVRL